MDWKEKAKQAGECSSAIPQIALEDVPDIELYMDQLVTFLDQRLNGGKKENAAQFITSTMVNNYTKARLIPPAAHKRYERRHVLGLSLVGQLKKVLSMQDLGRVSAVIQDSEYEGSLYNVFLTAQREAAEGSGELVSHAVRRCEENNITDNAALAAMAVDLAARAQHMTLLAERLLDAMETTKPEESRKKNR